MSDNAGQERSETQAVEQITKEPSAAPKREKDPKRVAAGKKLAEKNKQMREEHARYKALESQRVVEAPPETTTKESETETGGSDFLSQLSLTNIISLVGIGLTVYTIFFKKSGDTNWKTSQHAAWKEPVHTTYEASESKPKTEEARRVSKPKPKFGM